VSLPHFMIRELIEGCGLSDPSAMSEYKVKVVKAMCANYSDV
jgi:hypothetical protein